MHCYLGPWRHPPEMTAVLQELVACPYRNMSNFGSYIFQCYQLLMFVAMTKGRLSNLV